MSGALGLRHPGSTAIDLGALDAAISDADGGALGTLAGAIGGVLAGHRHTVLTVTTLNALDV